MEKDMETNTIIGAIANKPVTSIAVTQGSFLAGVLTYIGVLTPLIGFISVVFGCVVGFYSMRIQYRKWKDMNRKHIKPLHK
jgi:uncharacterized membrane protein YphA (DoxX/SURF4 family)